MKFRHAAASAVMLAGIAISSAATAIADPGDATATIPPQDTGPSATHDGGAIGGKTGTPPAIHQIDTGAGVASRPVATAKVDATGGHQSRIETCMIGRCQG